MPRADWRIFLKQVGHKPGKLIKVLKHNKPKERKFGYGVSKCRICGRSRGMIRKYKLNICRHCFNDIAKEMGWWKWGH